MTTILIIIVAMVAALVIFYFVRKKKSTTSSSPKPVVPAPSNLWRPMLGDAAPGPVKRTPKYGISYQANSFDVVKPKQIDKTVAWLTSQGADHLIGPFIAAANEVADMPKWIDDAYERSANQYRACGGKYASFIAGDDPTTLFVEVVATPMRHPTLPIWAGAMAFPDKKTVRIVIMTTGGMKDNPSTVVVESPATAHLALGKDYLVWEIGNALMLRYGFQPKRIPEDEWGSKSPCS